MTSEELKILSKMKQLVKAGKRRFQARHDRDYLQDLLELGLTEEAAWNEHILYLNTFFFYHDPKPNYFKEGICLIFKKSVNGILTYIKLKIENTTDGDEVVCISFHRDKYEDGD